MFYELTVVQFRKMLTNLNGLLDKAEQHATAKKFDTAVLLESRLAPDQFAFTRQIQILCDTAKRCVAQITGKEAPVHADDETTLAALRARIKSVDTYLGTFTAKDFANAATIKVTTPRWEGKHMTGQDFVIQHAVPNFYFHLTTTYALLRHNGVDVGKKDYLGQLSLRA